MTIITITGFSHTHSRDVAEAVAETLGYAFVSREDFLDALQELNIPWIKHVRGLPIILEQTIFKKYRYISYIRSELLRYLTKDNIVYHGSCGHVLLKDIDHVLKVEITADLEDRVKLLMDHEGFSSNEALLLIKTMDHAQKKWCQKLYNIDLSTIGQYDISLNISKFPQDKAVNIICKIAMSERFKTTAESQKAMDKLLTAIEIGAETLTDFDADRICSQASLMDV
jgi:cytidylate kinase